MSEAQDMLDKFQEECGVFGIYGSDDAAALAALGLHALQHRGQEACGIVSHDNQRFYAHRALGMVDETFNKADVLTQLKGHIAIAHNRYATTGETWLRNVQPLHADLDTGGFSIAHNGNLTNALTLREQFVKSGALFQSTSDTEVILHALIRSKAEGIHNRLAEALKDIEGAYALVCVGGNQLIGVRDPLGIRPLVLGRLGTAHVLTSETCALDIIGASYVRDIEPGEMVVIDGEGLRSHFPFGRKSERFCVFEYIYFARPDSAFNGRSVYKARFDIGKALAKQAPCEGAELIVPVPDSGVPAALGFAEGSGVPFGYGIIRNHYVGRTFIQPTDQIRHLGVKLKHNPNKALIQGKSIVLVDDSIVRGTTSKKIVEMVRQAGAREVHMRIAAPPTKYGCFYGVDTPDSNKLLAHTHSVQQIADFIGVDSLAYISIDGLYDAIGDKRAGFCDACFSGDYPVALTDKTANSCGPASSLSNVR